VAGAGNAPIVRVFIDRACGIGIDDLVSANAWLAPILDEVDELSDSYTLEVSSPGIDRPLRKLADFERFAGVEAKVTTSQPVGERKHFTGMLEGVEGEHVLIDVDGTTYRIPYATVSKARLAADIDSFGKD
jgi:ribosome maturation factor RimP